MTRPRAIIAGTGSHLPPCTLTNADLSKMVETNDEWIIQRTGIRERRIVSPGESSATIGAAAAREALKSAGFEPRDIGLVLLATITPEMVTPSTACFVAAELGMNSTPAMDLNAACSGFLYAMDTAAAFIESGRYRNVLVIGAETMTRITDFTDRGTCILFGDAAGAVVMSRGESTSTDKPRGLLYSSLHADGNGWDFIFAKPGSRHPIDQAMVESRDQYIKMRGRDVYKFAVQRFQEMLEDALAKAELSVDEVTLVVPHQVNQRIIDSAMEKLGIPTSKALVNLDRLGNTSAASIPVALDEAVKAGRLKQGDVAVFVAFGAGLTWANAVVRM
jgi:3-oxoacyl-[acyl-carrier-protein] synthase-3